MFSQTEILLMIFVVSVLLIFIVVLTILDIMEYRRNKDSLNDNVLNEDFVIQDEEPKKQDEVTIMEEGEAKEENLSYVDDDKDLFVELEEEPLEKKIVEPLVNTVEEKIVEPVVKVENNIEENINVVNDTSIVESEITYNDYVEEEMPKRVNLNEELSKVQETMVSEDEVERKVLSFEEEQERTAIISLDELMQKTDDLYNENEVVQYDDGNEPISIDEVISMYNKEEKEISIPEVQQIVEEKIEEKKELYTKKEEIPFISSIYGIEKNEMSFENTATYEKLDREKSNEFMRELKERIENH